MTQYMDVRSGFGGAAEDRPGQPIEREQAIETTRSGSRRAGLRLWTWLHAQALLQGTIGGVHDVAFIEDDRGRLAAPQAVGRRRR